MHLEKAEYDQAQRWSARGYAGQSWRYGVPPECWPGATVGSENLDWEPGISLRNVVRGEKHGWPMSQSARIVRLRPGEPMVLRAARL